MRTRSLHRGLALSLMGLASVVLANCGGGSTPTLAWRDVFFERNVEWDTHDLSHGATGRHWSRDVDV